MADFVITSPEGQKFKITAPEGASEDEVLAFASQNMPEPKPSNDILDSVKQSAASGVKNIASFGSTEPTYQAETGLGKFVANATRPFRPVMGAIELATAPATAVIEAGVSKPVERVAGPEAGMAAGILASLYGPAGIRKGTQAISNRVANAAIPQQIAPTAEQVAKTSGDAYKLAEKSGGVLLNRVTNRFVSQAQKVLPQTAAGKIVAGKDTPSAQVIERIKGLKGRELTLREAQEVDELLGDAIDGFVENGVLKKEGRKLLQVQDALRKTIEEAPPIDIRGGKKGFEALKTARKEWARSAKLRDVEKIITRAEMMQNPAQALKTGFRTLYNNPTRMRGYSAAEKAAIRKAATSGNFADALSTFGSRLTQVIGLGTGNPGVALAATAGSTLARKGAEGLQLRRAKELSDLIALGEQIKAVGRPVAKPLPQGMAPAMALSLGAQ